MAVALWRRAGYMVEGLVGAGQEGRRTSKGCMYVRAAVSALTSCSPQGSQRHGGIEHGLCTPTEGVWEGFAVARKVEKPIRCRHAANHFLAPVCSSAEETPLVHPDIRDCHGCPPPKTLKLGNSEEAKSATLFTLTPGVD